MDKALRDKWVKALRSGRYRQGKWNLRSDGPSIADSRFCCLGVLAQVAKRDKWKRANDNWYIRGELAYLPDGYLDWDTQSQLSFMNDLEQSDFSKIADWIEENIPVEETSDTRTGEANAE